MNGKRHGIGRHYLKDNRYREGVWHLDKRIKWNTDTIGNESKIKQ